MVIREITRSGATSASGCPYRAINYYLRVRRRPIEGKVMSKQKLVEETQRHQAPPRCIQEVLNQQGACALLPHNEVYLESPKAGKRATGKFSTKYLYVRLDSYNPRKGGNSLSQVYPAQ